MNLKQVVIDKVNEMGLKPAAAYFGKSEQAIRSWVKTNGVIPLDAVEKVLSEGVDPLYDSSAKGDPFIESSAPLKELVLPDANAELVMAGQSEEFETIWKKLDELNSRVKSVELVVFSDSTSIHASVVPPKTITPQIVQTSPVIPTALPESMPGATGWTRPHNFARRPI